MKKRILLVEDDPHLGYILKEYLQMHEFDVELANDGDAGQLAFTNKNFDIAILDVMMPKKDGFTLAEEIKSQSPQMPIIFLTAKSLKVDKLKGFKLGADDYILKPVDEEELIARIQAVLKRSGGSLSDEKLYTIGKFMFDPNRQQLKCNEAVQKLTQMESRVLQLLCESTGRVLESDQMMKTLWGQSDYFKKRSMDVFISKLRKYLSDDPSVKITNVHSRGYILEIN